MVRRRLDPDAMYPAGEPGIAARFVETRSGLRIRIAEAGPEGGEPVLLVPGWASSIYVFRHLLPALGAAGFRAVAFDPKGYGLSDKPADAAAYSADALVEDVAELLDALGLERTMLVGMSLGGGVAARAAMAMPERITRLVLLSPVGFGDVRLSALTPLLPSWMRIVLPYAGWRAFFVIVLEWAYGPYYRPSARDVDEYWSATRDPGYLRAQFALLRGIDWRPLGPEAIRRLLVPTLVVFGANDRVIVAKRVRDFARHLPLGETVVLPRGGHLVHEQFAEEVNGRVIEWLEAAESRNSSLER